MSGASGSFNATGASAEGALEANNQQSQKPMPAFLHTTARACLKIVAADARRRIGSRKIAAIVRLVTSSATTLLCFRQVLNNIVSILNVVSGWFLFVLAIKAGLSTAIEQGQDFRRHSIASHAAAFQMNRHFHQCFLRRNPC